MKKLTALFNLPELKNDIELHNMVLDSRKVKAGDLFVAIKGHQVDGNQFIDPAIDSGASAVVSETELSSEHLTVTFYSECTSSKVLSTCTPSFVFGGYFL